MKSLSEARILLIVGGGVAAYKSLDLIRRLRERGASARIVLTEAAQKFITPLSAASLSASKAHVDLFSLTDEAEMGHIELSRAADLLVVAPATADLLAKMAQGHANDLASTLLLATDKRILAAPAMNVRMWLHPATRRNLDRLKADGVLFIGPEDGEMACGEFGPGRMAEPLAIVAAIERALAAGTALPLDPAAKSAAPAGELSGLRVIVTSGPTHEPIDPVRYIANRSSGRQGHAIAAAAAEAGADVILVSGPVALADPLGVRTLRVETAAQMLAAVESSLPCDIFVAAAAVADWRVDRPSGQKAKKTRGEPPVLKLVENPDILAAVAKSRLRPRLVVGFAAETSDLIAHAKSKLVAKNCDFVVANDVGPGSGVMGGLRNTISLIRRSGVENWPEMTKEDVARRLVKTFSGALKGDGV